MSSVQASGLNDERQVFFFASVGEFSVQFLDSEADKHSRWAGMSNLPSLRYGLLHLAKGQWPEQ
jgi:hypothetical protein